MNANATATKIAEALMAHLQNNPQVVVSLNDYAEFENVCDELESRGCRFERMPANLQLVLHRQSSRAPISEIAIVPDQRRK